MAKAKKKTVKKSSPTTNGSNGKASSPSHMPILKTYKLYIGGKFPRTESGRFFSLKGPGGEVLANVCRGSRKDFRNAVGVARKAQAPWAGRAAFNRSQILYRIAEMLDGRRAQFIAELCQTGLNPVDASNEVNASVDRLVYYAGWCDKYQQIFSSVNPVASPHFNFSVPEPMGVIAAFAPEDTGLLGLVSVVAPIIAGGNSIVILASDQHPLPAITFAEVLNSSDVPGGVVNILTGHREELASHMATHKDVNGMVFTGLDQEMVKLIQEGATENVKRILLWKNQDWDNEKGQSPYFIQDAQEIKTTWHPVGGAFGGGSAY